MTRRFNPGQGRYELCLADQLVNDPHRDPYHPYLHNEDNALLADAVRRGIITLPGPAIAHILETGFGNNEPGAENFISWKTIGQVLAKHPNVTAEIFEESPHLEAEYYMNQWKDIDAEYTAYLLSRLSPEQLQAFEAGYMARHNLNPESCREGRHQDFLRSSFVPLPPVLSRQVQDLL